MERLLARLERRLGGFAIPNLTHFIVGGMALVFVLVTLRASFLGAIVLDIGRVKHGEVWRLVSYLFIPSSFHPIWVLFSLYMTWLIGSRLDSEWGAFKFNVYYLLGMLGTTIAAVIVQGAVGNTYLNYSLFFAFATLFPDFELLLLIFPVRVKWLALLLAAYLGYELVGGDWISRAAILASTINYFLFFSGHLMGLLRGRNLQVRQEAQRESLRAPPTAIEHVGRNCAICGATETEGADIRVCSCATCGGQPRNLCLMHAKKH